MTLSEMELSNRWGQIYGMPRGTAKFEAIDFILRHADAAGYEQQALEWRLEAISEFHHGGDPARAFLAFSKCLATLDRDPGLARSYTEHQLLWRFKWIVWALPQFPEIPLERTFAVLDDMQARYLRAGHSLHAVYQHRWLVSHHIGLSDADEWYGRLITAKRDGLSDCAHCVPSSQVRHLVTVGRDEEAIEVGAPFTRGGCTEQPQWMLSELLLPYLRTGRLEEAADAHRVGYAHMRTDRHHLDNIAQHVYFCGLSGNEVRGLELIDRHRGWLDAPSSPYAAMEFAAAAALVLRRVGETADADQMAGVARGIAARFDARNGNTHQSTRVEARMAAEPIGGQAERVPLTAMAGRRRGVPESAARLLDLVGDLTSQGDLETAARTLLKAATALHQAKREDDAIETAEEAVRALDRQSRLGASSAEQGGVTGKALAGRLGASSAEQGGVTGKALAGVTEDGLRARALLWELYRHRHDYRDRADELLRELLAAPGLPDGVPSRGELCEQGGWFVEAADHYRNSGDRIAELRALVSALRKGEETVLERAERVAGEAADVPADALAAIDGFAARALFRAGDYAGAEARAMTGLRRGPEAHDVLERLRLAGARALLRLDRPAQAEPLAREAADDYSYIGASLLVLALRRLGRDGEAAEAMEQYGIDEDDLRAELEADGDD